MIDNNGYCNFTIEQDDLQDRLGGGLPPGSLFVVEGEYGTGKSLLSERFCYGLLENNYDVSFVSTESDTYSFMRQMESLSYSIKENLLSKQLEFYPVFSSFEKYVVDGSEFIPRLKQASGLFKSKVIIFDSISSIYKEAKQSAEEGNVDVSSLLSFFNQKCTQGKIIVLTVDPTEISDQFLSSLRSSADIFFELSRETYGGQTDHLLYIRRFSEAQGVSKDVLKFRVEAGAGFIVDITKIS